MDLAIAQERTDMRVDPAAVECQGFRRDWPSTAAEKFAGFGLFKIPVANLRYGRSGSGGALFFDRIGAMGDATELCASQLARLLGRQLGHRAEC